MVYTCNTCKVRTEELHKTRDPRYCGIHFEKSCIIHTTHTRDPPNTTKSIYSQEVHVRYLLSGKLVKKNKTLVLFIFCRFVPRIATLPLLGASLSSDEAQILIQILQMLNKEMMLEISNKMLPEIQVCKYYTLTCQRHLYQETSRAKYCFKWVSS